MFSETVAAVIGWAKRVVTKPLDELSRWQRAARFVYDLSRYGGRQLRRDRAPQMAAALAFHTLFALAPVLIVSLIVVKSVSGMDRFELLMSELFTSMGLDDVRIVLPGGAAVGEQPPALSTWLIELIRQASDINVAAVGWVGVGAIAYSAISLLVTIESSFNAVLHAPQGRAWTRRAPIYWFVLTVSPVVIGAAWRLDQRLDAWIDAVVGWEMLLTAIGLAGRVLALWLVLLAAYALLPTAHIRLKLAAIGALVSAAVLEVGGRFVGASLEHMISLSQLYGSLGTAPLFMFWVYLMWLVVLFGLELAATLQSLHGRELDKIEHKSPPTGLMDPACAVSLMEVVAQQFAAGRATTAQHAAEEMLVAEPTVEAVFRALVDASVLHWVDVEARSVTLARPAEKISAAELLEAGYKLADRQSGEHSGFVERLRDAQRRLAAQTTLANLAAE